MHTQTYEATHLIKYQFLLFSFSLWALLSLTSCLPIQTESNRRITQDNTSGLNDGAGTNTSQLFWFHNSQQIFNALTVNEDLNSVVFLRGKAVETFLNLNNNFQKTFCLLATYAATGAKTQMRVRATPAFFNNFSTQSIERYFRIDLDQNASNASVCTGTVSGVAMAGSAFALDEVCTTCNTIIKSTSVKIYQVSSGISDNTLVSNNLFNLSGLGLNIDTASSQNNGGQGLCTNSSCQTLGFDCCLNNNCVNDGVLKSNASSLYPNDFVQSQADIAINPLAYVNYPHIYNVCGTGGLNPPPSNPNDPTQDAKELLQTKINYYYCLTDQLCEEGFSEYCDNSYTCQNETENLCPNTITNLPTYDTQAERWLLGAGIQSISCDVAGTGVTEAQVQTIVNKMCGCDPSNPPSGDPTLACQDTFIFHASKNPAGKITAVACDNLNSDTDPPFSTTFVDVSARSVPHRFFRATNGLAVDNITSIAGTGVIPEGTEFQYLDNLNKTDPDNGQFNMNSITGQFSVTLDQAFPAKMIPVNDNENYTIFVNSGFYSPCPLCSKDSWFQAFSAHPNSSAGRGLQAVGHTTSRDAFSTNLTLGNYEDTLFGRACFVPPTMLPFSHTANADGQTQRLNRLQTQAALWINGYQRDWFGFNKGALIGSFDGVSWFAIGSGRRVTAKSDKLYLAINGVMGDLADQTSTNVTISLTNSNDTVAKYDFDPDLTMNNPSQNQGASCQQYHLCDDDTDCVTKLGWEYMCANINSVKTLWPTFTDEDENVNTADSKFLSKIIVGGLKATTKKRCVYRGSGSVCKQNYSALPLSIRKNFTCAPNFWCKKITQSFNDEIIRTPLLADNILFGKEANVLGRPEKYLNGSVSLPNAVISTLEANLDNQHSSFATDDDYGICQPGKFIDTNANPHMETQHANRDNQNRTDYISQVGSCNSATTGLNRVQSCPMLDPTSGDYTFITTPTFTSAADQQQLRLQNTCGAGAKNAGGTSAFVNIEKNAIGTFSSIVTPSIVQDACFRRPGAVCHSDLDCSPNALHATTAAQFATSFFGGSTAEKNYWQESMICGQQNPVPALNSVLFADFDISENRCCRAQGQKFTMITANDPEGDPSGQLARVGVTDLPFLADNPMTARRYSRYAVVEDLNVAIATVAVRPQAPEFDAGEVPLPFQWLAFKRAGEKTCCGGGWVRQFADGTHDWTDNTRLNIDVSEFQCVNYRHTIYKEKPTGTLQANYDIDFSNLCFFVEFGGCPQFAFSPGTNNNIQYPEVPPTLTASIETFREIPFDDLTEYTPFAPLTRFVSAVGALLQSDFTYGTINDDYVAFRLPGYIDPLDISFTVEIKYYLTNGNISTPVLATNVPGLPCTASMVAAALETECYDPSSGILYVKHDPGIGNLDKASIKLNFIPNNVIGYAGMLANNPSVGQTPGNEFYYLSKLGRLELLGVPQILYEPISCNDEQGNMVGGIFLNDADWTTFIAGAPSFNYTTGSADANAPLTPAAFYDNTKTVAETVGSRNQVSYVDGVALDKIFSASEFSCCAPIGSIVTDQTKCCSNHGVADISTGEITCMMPSGLDLHVYFNKFISGEGIDEDLPGGGLIETDFNSMTGEPLYNDTVRNKIRNIGEAFCSSGTVIAGGAFGHYPGQPNSGSFGSSDGSLTRVYGLLDSPEDIDDDTDPDNPRGFNQFQNGYRWNHHLYCQ